MQQISIVQALALNTFREIVRDKVIYSFMVFAVVITFMSIMLGSLSVGQNIRILEDVGLAAISLISGAIAVFAGANLVYKELERKTVFIIFTKPVTGSAFVIGKYLGLALTIMVVVLAMGLFLSSVVAMVEPNPTAASALSAVLEMALPVALIYVELLFVIALATFFSTFSSPLMSVIFTLSLWLIGHLGASLRQLGMLSHNTLFAGFSQAVYFTLPDLAGLTRARSLLMYGRQAPPEVMYYITCYVVAYVIVLLVLSAAVTERREFY